jgi:Tol biopolymer transport system component
MGAGIGGAGIYDLEAGSFGTVGDALVRGVLLARWAPDSTHVLLVGDADQTGVVGIASADDTAFSIVSGSATNVVDAAWSPSGERLLFVAASPRSSDLGTLYTVATRGTGMKQVHAGLIAATSATWWPEGQ